MCVHACVHGTCVHVHVCVCACVRVSVRACVYISVCLCIGQVFSYVPKRWRLEPNGQGQVSRAKKKEPGSTDGKTGGVSPTSGLIQTLEGGVLTKRSSRIASRKEPGEG